MNYKPIFSIIKNYRWQSLFFKYWKILIVFFAVPLVIAFISSTQLYKVSRQSEFDQYFLSSALKIKSDMDLVVSQIENFYNITTTDPVIIEFLENSNPEPVNIDNYEIQTLILNQFSKFKSNNSYIDSVFIYSYKSDYVISSRASGFKDNYYYSYIVDEHLSSSAHITVSTMGSGGDQKSQYLTLSYPLYLNTYSKADGVLIISMDFNTLAKHLISPLTNESILLYKPDGTPLISMDGIDENSIKQCNTIYSNSLNKINSSDYSIHQSRDNVICYIPLKSLNLIMSICSFKNGKNIANSFIIFFVLLLIFMLIVTLAFSFYTSVVIYKSIANIISEIGIPPDYDAATENEAAFISNKLLTTLKHQSDISEELTQKVQLLKKSQTLALQSQINPHFIFNTLNLVNLMIIRITQENSTPSQIISLLSDILYYSMKSDKFITTLNEELKYTEKYIQIEKMKYNNMFDFNFEIDDSVRDCKIVKFTLQPILENCITHGIKSLKNRSGSIKLQAFRCDDMLNIFVTDNGSGITTQKYDELISKLNSDELPTGKHIGLVNVNQRIKLVFGEKYGVKVVPLEQGLRVELAYPFEM